MPTIEQIRAARALLGWNQTELADQAGLSQTGIARIENGTNQPNTHTLKKIEQAFDKADIEFIDNSGVRKRTGEVRTLKGQSGFIQFLDEIYETIKRKGGLICLHNAKPHNWYKWAGEEFYNKHAKRMSEIQNQYQFRITTKEGETNLISTDFAEYRLIPEHMFNEHSIYAYDNNLVFVTFEENDVTVRIIENKAFVDGFQAMFNIMWENVAKKLDRT